VEKTQVYVWPQPWQIFLQRWSQERRPFQILALLGIFTYLYVNWVFLQRYWYAWQWRLEECMAWKSEKTKYAWMLRLNRDWTRIKCCRDWDNCDIWQKFWWIRIAFTYSHFYKSLGRCSWSLGQLRLHFCKTDHRWKRLRNASIYYSD
jgi:hypothetical protein